MGRLVHHRFLGYLTGPAKAFDVRGVAGERRGALPTLGEGD